MSQSVAEPGFRPGPTAFPSGGKRVVFYLYYDPRGIVDDYVPYKLERLREHADHIFVVVNGTLRPEGRARLEAVADTVWERSNTGFDVWGYKSALDEFGSERLAAYDELVLMNYTWFGPVGDFAPVFERMAARPVHFWGMTDHAEVIPNPYTRKGRLPRHIQSHWIAVRKLMFASEEWRRYWAEMPPITSYVESILRHESRFTEHFETSGWATEVAFPQADYPADHPAFDNADRLLADGCPVLKRRPFFHSPLYLDKEAILGRRLLELAEEKGYPTAMVLQNMARNAQPRILNTNASLFRVLSDDVADYDVSKPPRVAAIVHIFYEDMTQELLDRLDLLPVDYDLYVTTTDAQKAAVIEAAINAHPGDRVRRSEVRILPSNRGRDLSAYFVACRDIAGSADYDLIVKIHSKKTVQSAPNIGSYFKGQQLENLLSSAAYAANVLGLFQREPGLGMVFPPTVHIGHPTLGGAWFENREKAEEVNAELGIRVPLDDVSPLAPMGAMWICRPAALKLMTDHEWAYDDYALETDHRDGSLAHVQERIVTYAAGELGYHVRTVANADHTEMSYAFLEFKYDQLGSTVPGTAMEKVQVMRGRGLSKTLITFAKSYMVHRWPRFSQVLIVFPYRPARAVYRWARRRGQQ